MKKMKSSSNTTCKPPTLEEIEERKRKEPRAWALLHLSWKNDGMNSFGIHLNLYKWTFTLSPSITSLIYILSQMKGHLIHYKSSAIALITKVNVLFEIQLLVSRATIFDKIRENLYLRKSSCFPLFESKLNPISSISFIIIPLSPNQSLETNFIELGH